MLTKILISRKVLPSDVWAFATKFQAGQLRRLAKNLTGLRVVHINATADGGGVAEILQSLVPYLRALGLESDWYVIDGQAERKFFEFTNKLHNALQGSPARLTASDWALYQQTSSKLSQALAKIDSDVLVMHDPQLLLAGSMLPTLRAKIYYSHIDTSTANQAAWLKVAPWIGAYDLVIFSNKEFVNAKLKARRIKVFTPAIDPLAPKQRLVSKNAARKYLAKYGLSAGKPLVAQISRFDIWKNPLGVIEAFRLAQAAQPDLQLALVGFNQAKDNPKALAAYQDVAAIAANSPNIHLFFNTQDFKPLDFTVNVQNGADVIVQNSSREGFGLTVAEAMWKGQAVIGGPASGIRTQIVSGKNGFIVESAFALADRIIYLLNNPKRAKVMGKAARNSVRRHFLFPRLVADHLRAYLQALTGS